MSMRELEASIIEEVRQITGRRKLRLKDLLEWKTAPIAEQPGEIVVHCPQNGVYAAVPKEKE